MKEQKIINNLQLNFDKNFLIVSVNPKIYSLDVVYSAAKGFLDKAYLVIDGDPKNEIIVEIKPKKKASDLETLGRDFNNELIRFAADKAPQRQDLSEKPKSVSKQFSEEDSEEMSYIDDPLGIARPWEEVYGKGGDKQDRQRS